MLSEIAYGELPNAPRAWFCFSNCRIRMAKARAAEVKVTLMKRKSCGKLAGE